MFLSGASLLHKLKLKTMQKIFKPFSAAALVLLSITAVVAAVTALDTETFETDFIKSLKEKFKTFYSKAEHDRVYVQTDKSFYRPGETIWFTAYVRDEKNVEAI